MPLTESGAVLPLPPDPPLPDPTPPQLVMSNHPNPMTHRQYRHWRCATSVQYLQQISWFSWHFCCFHRSEKWMGRGGQTKNSCCYRPFFPCVDRGCTRASSGEPWTSVLCGLFLLVALMRLVCTSTTNVFVFSAHPLPSSLQNCQPIIGNSFQIFATTTIK